MHVYQKRMRKISTHERSLSLNDKVHNIDVDLNL